MTTGKDKEAQEIDQVLKALKGASTEDAKNAAIEDLARLGKKLDVRTIQSVIACGCGPHGERGIDPWPI